MLDALPPRSSLSNGEGRRISTLLSVEDRQSVCLFPALPAQAGCCSPQQADSSPLNLGCLWDLTWPTALGLARLAY